MKRNSVYLAISLLCSLAAASVPASAQLADAGAPYDVSARSYPGPQQAIISWESSAPAVTGFRVERRLPSGGAWNVVGLVDGAARNFIDAELKVETTYEYRVAALGPEAAAPVFSTAQVSLTTPAAAAGKGYAKADYDSAAAPRRLVVQPLNSTDLMLEWSDATPDETEFKIQRRDPGRHWHTIGSVGPNVTLYRDNGLQSGAAYEYRVTALRPSGRGATGLAAGATLPPAGAANVFYVDIKTGSNNNPGTEERPWATLQKAHGMLQPGQTVLVRKGTYTSTTNYTVLLVNRSGNEGAPITYRNFPGERPLVKTTKGVNNHGIEIRDAAYIVIDGFEVEGHVKQVTLAEAKVQNELALAYSKLTPQKYIGAIVDSNGISVTGKTIKKTHHVVVRNNIVRDTPGGGIAANFTDYVTIDNNRVSNTSAYSPYGTSGISFLTPYNLDTNTGGYKLVVSNNTVTGASNLFPCSCFGFKQQTDGNGIIIDSFNKFAYTGRTLVANNIVHNNGGRGIHALNANYLDVFHNTAYRNGTIKITGEGEITLQKTRFVRVWNNIMVANADRPANLYTQSTDGDFSHNIVFGGNRFTPTPRAVNNRLATDPLFTATGGAFAFQLAANSPAVNSAHNEGVPVVDVYAAPRPRGAAADVGAVESF